MSIRQTDTPGNPSESQIFLSCRRGWAPKSSLTGPHEVLGVLRGHFSAASSGARAGAGLCCRGLPHAWGPGLWPGPCRQARLGRWRLRAQGWVLKILSAERLERIFGCPCGWRGRPGQCAAFRSRLCDSSPGGRTPGARLDGRRCLQARHLGGMGGPHAAPYRGAERGSSSGRRASARRARRKLPPRDNGIPGDLGR